MGATLHHGDCREILATMPDHSVDAVVTDPPYALNFMGRAWDRFTPAEFQAWCEKWAAECLRVLKPGGHMVAFGGTRTWHRLTAGVEDAGFEIRDSIAWLYGSGFPKSLDVSKAIDKGEGYWRGRAGAVKSSNGSMGGANYQRTDKGAPVTPAARQWQGWGTALKPAFEPIVVARKPLEGTVAANVLAHGTGGLNIDGCRVPMSQKDADVIHKLARSKHNGRIREGQVMNRPAAPTFTVHKGGRWPSNVLLDELTAREVDAQSGRASRFFPVFRYQAKAPSSERPKANGVTHPTVKPLALMRWLVRLVTPPGGVVLDPFAGSGTTGQAALEEGFSVILIEREADYLPLIEARLSREGTCKLL